MNIGRASFPSLLSHISDLTFVCRLEQVRWTPLPFPGLARAEVKSVPGSLLWAGPGSPGQMAAHRSGYKSRGVFSLRNLRASLPLSRVLSGKLSTVNLVSPNALKRQLIHSKQQQCNCFSNKHGFQLFIWQSKLKPHYKHPTQTNKLSPSNTEFCPIFEIKLKPNTNTHKYIVHISSYLFEIKIVCQFIFWKPWLLASAPLKPPP